MKLESSGQIFEKCSNIKFYENSCSGSRVVPRGGRERHDEADSRFWKILRTRLKKLVDLIHIVTRTLMYKNDCAQSGERCRCPQF